MSVSADSYLTLSSSSDRSQVKRVLQSITLSPPASSPSTLKTLIQSILDDAKDHASGSGRLKTADLDSALLAVKTMGHTPNGSRVISNEQNFATLHHLIKTLPDTSVAFNLALRCVANAMLLVEDARLEWIEEPLSGGTTVLDYLDKVSEPEAIFLACRILFLGTVSKDGAAAPFIINTVEGRGIDIIASKLSSLIQPIIDGVKMSREAATDLLKFVFNILVHYPKLVDCEPQNPAVESSSSKNDAVMGDFWSPNLAPLLPDLLKMYTSLTFDVNAPMLPPTTHLVHALISIPVNQALREHWFNSSAEAESSATVQRTKQLIESSLSRYLPGAVDPDEDSVRSACEADSGNSLDDLCAPTVLLLTRLALADSRVRLNVRQWLVPPDLDRNSALETRPDLLGRCLRILPSVYHPKLKDAIGELLFAASNSDASTLSALVGYGNVAGFLFNKGVMSAPDAPPETSDQDGVSLSTDTGDAINPITGTVQKETKSATAEMTEEEKEREAEKLFVLFDRLEKTGAMSANQNPIRKMAEKGLLG